MTSTFNITKDDVLDVLDAPGEVSEIKSGLMFMVLAYVNEFDLEQVDTIATARLARAYLAAHICSKLAQAADGSAGPVTSESVGGVRRAYGLMASSSSTSALSSTGYGQMFLEIINMSGAAGPQLVGWC